MLVFVPSGMLISNGSLPNRRKGNETRLITSRRQTGIVNPIHLRRDVFSAQAICTRLGVGPGLPQDAIHLSGGQMIGIGAAACPMHEPNSNGLLPWYGRTPSLCYLATLPNTSTHSLGPPANNESSLSVHPDSIVEHYATLLRLQVRVRQPKRLFLLGVPTFRSGMLLNAEFGPRCFAPASTANAASFACVKPSTMGP
ncbi:hypothetical protein CCUS01_12686 [Colletotrichum cuscutae]|uniref:Uncharacterized protein n=1 Tax=Colletotrichum cuscutae TaxID=1209917 RepID=A0AAI9TTZ9_9PEZI|nr:hypothetical protein CCUS01_12686 [Colletotrichum cuscutae]